MDRFQQKHKNADYFYELLDEFMEELICVFPEAQIRIKRYSLLTNTARKINYMSPIRVFYDAVFPFKDQIENCDDGYFMNETNMIDIVEGDKKSLIEGLALKSLWCNPNTTMEIKAAIWCYLQQLLQYSEKIC